MDDKVKSFEVVYRNFGHWDIVSRDHTPAPWSRVFRIRGGPGRYRVIDEREKSIQKDVLEFKTVAACMSYICDELMFELIVAEGQKPTIIESWNV